MLKDRIRELRKARGWTQEELAARAGMTQGVITNLERGARDNPTQETLDKLAGALGVPVSELLGEGDILSGDFPAGQLDREGITALLPEAMLLRYSRLWPDLHRADRAWLIGHLRILADAERRVREMERTARDHPDGAAPAGAEGALVAPDVVPKAIMSY